MTEQLPPQAIEIERSVLAACIMSPDAIDTCIDILCPDDFYRTSHQKIFKAVTDIRAEKNPVDASTLVQTLRDRKELEEVGGAIVISKLIEEAPMSMSVTHHAGIVKDKSVLRQIIRHAQVTIQDAFESQSSTELLDATQQRFLDIANPLAFQFTTMRDLMARTVDLIERCSNGLGDIALPTGLPDLDKNLGGGFRGPKFVIIAARPGIGKTAMMLNMAGSIAANFKRRGSKDKVGIMELEMTDEELGIRSIAMGSGINTVYLFSGREETPMGWKPFGPESWALINKAASKLSDYPVLFDDTPALLLQEVVRRVRMLHKKGCKIVFIDQLSKIRGPGAKEYDRMTNIVNRLAELKKELRMPIVLLAQINREMNLKGTGSLEEDADIIMRLKQTNDAIGTDGNVFKACLVVEKHRGGPTGVIELQWIPRITAFRGLSETIYA